MPEGRVPGTQKTRERVAFARLLAQRGMTRKEIVAQVRTQYRISYESANRTMRYIEREMEIDINKSRGALVARQSAKLNHAQRVAMSAVKHFAHKGEVVDSKPEPEIGAFISAIAEQNRLLGLHAPSAKDLMVLNLRELMRDIVFVVRRYIPDREEREEFISQLAERFDERRAERPTMIPAEIVEVDAAAPPGVEPGVVTPPPPDHRGNGSGSTNGHNGTSP
jgi:hypothetical protein